MNIGVSYYPEYNNKQDWKTHFQKISDAGIKRVRMAEFSWSLIQPHEDVFNWQWLDESISLAQQFNIEIVLGTPTSCPPIWLVEKYPEVLPVNKEGRRTSFGARQHRCYNSPAYIYYSSKLVDKMAERYGKHPNIGAWQIDNELGGEQKYCYCQNCKKAFQKYLKNKYDSIENLNERWMNHFWSQDYSKWDQIPVPVKFASDLDMKHHPSLQLEFMRFSSNSIVNFCNMQYSIIKRHTNKCVTTNTDSFLFGDNVNLHDLFKTLDIGAIDIYSDDPCEISFYCDITRSLKGNNFWMMEFGTGSPNLVKHMDLCKNSGCEWFLLFTFLPFPAGQEQGFKGLLTITGSEEPNYHNVKKWIEENSMPSASSLDANIGIVYDFDSSWQYNISSWGSNIIDKQVYPKYMMQTVYKSFFEEGLTPLQFIYDSENIDIGKFKVIVAPMHAIYDKNKEDAMIRFVKNGGILVATSDLFIKNADNVFFTSIPNIYKEILNLKSNDFPQDATTEDYIIASSRVDSGGEMWIIKEYANINHWKLICNRIKELI